jgi:hypothetical protein
MEDTLGLWGSEIDTNFREAGRPERWAPLAAGTIAHRFARHMAGVKSGLREAKKTGVGLEGAGARFFLAERLFSGRQTPLIDTGELEKGASDPSNWSVEGGNPAIAQMRDPTGYGLYHLVGRDTPNFMPVRDWAFISDEALDEAGIYMTDYITQGLP